MLKLPVRKEHVCANNAPPHAHPMQPTLQQADAYEAVFSPGRATFRRLDHEIEVTTELAVSSDDDVELRRSASEAVVQMASVVLTQGEWTWSLIEPLVL